MSILMNLRVRRWMIPFLILILLSSYYSSSYGDFIGITTEVYITVPGQPKPTPERGYRVSRRVKVGDYIMVVLGIKNELMKMIWVFVNYDFIQGEDIAGTISTGNQPGGISPHGSGTFVISFHELPSVGIIGLNFSYEGFYMEGDEKKTFTSGGSVHEVYLEVKKSLFDWRDVIMGVAIFGGILTIVFIIYRHSKKSSTRLTTS